MPADDRVAQLLDECECGDYRGNHDEVTGMCRLCAWSSAPWDTCTQFRLWREAERG